MPAPLVLGALAQTAIQSLAGPAIRVASGLGAIKLGQTAGRLYRKDSNLEAFGTNNVFPSDLQKQRFYISFSFMNYRRRSIYDRAFLTGNGSIKLPMPQQLMDKQSVSYEVDKAGTIAGAALEGAVQQGGSVIASAGAGAIAVAGATGGPLATTAGINPNQIGSLNGVAVNPFLTVLFKSPEFKRHSFSWRLSPNNAAESRVLVNIVEKFRYHMLPGFSAIASAGALLSYPDVAIVELFPNNQYLYKFKPCVVESIGISYAPNPTPSFFEASKAPTDVMLTVNLLEIEYWLKTDVNPNMFQNI